MMKTRAPDIEVEGARIALRRFEGDLTNMHRYLMEDVKYPHLYRACHVSYSCLPSKDLNK